MGSSAKADPARHCFFLERPTASAQLVQIPLGSFAEADPVCHGYSSERSSASAQPCLAGRRCHLAGQASQLGSGWMGLAGPAAGLGSA